jgi:hypothetical protein
MARKVKLLEEEVSAALKPSAKMVNDADNTEDNIPEPLIKEDVIKVYNVIQDINHYINNKRIIANIGEIIELTSTQFLFLKGFLK